jgi:glutamine cyclotransferase
MAGFGRHLGLGSLRADNMSRNRRQRRRVAMPRPPRRITPLIGEALEPRHLLAGTASISGIVFDDANGNQARDAVEQPRAGTVVYLDLNDNGALDATEPQTTTAANGSYSFANLDAGSYVVREIAPANHRITFPDISGRKLFAVDTSATPDRIVELDPVAGTVLRGIPAPVATSFGDLGLAFDGQTLYFLSDSNDTIYELNPATGAVLDSMTLPSGNYGSLAALGNKLYVLTWVSGTVSIVNPATNSIVGSYDLDSINPGLSHDDVLGNAAATGELVTATEDSVVFINATTGAKTSSFTIPEDFSRSSIEVIGDDIYVGDSFPSKFDIYSRASGAFLRTLPLTVNPIATAGYGDSSGSHRLTLADGQSRTNIDFGNQFALVSLRGTRWQDLDADGVRDAEDPPAAGRIVYLDLNDDGLRGSRGGVEPDQFADGTIINTINPAVVLSRVDENNNPFQSNVVVKTDSRQNTSTGTKSFAYGAGVDWWNNTSRLKMAFTTPVNRVSIDFSGGEVLGTNIGRLNAYNADGVLLGTYVTSALAPGADETMTVSRPTAEIAYAVAFTDAGGGTFGMLDNLRFEIIEPATITAADGSYAFTNLPAGKYVVREEVATGHQHTFPRVAKARLFVTDAFEGKIFELSPATGAILNSFADPGDGSIYNGLAFDGKTLYSLNNSNRTLYEINPDTGAVLDSTVLPSGSFEGVAALGGLVYIRNLFDGKISVFDPVSDTVTRTITITGQAAAYVYDGLGEMTGPDRLLGRNLDSEIFQIDPATGAATVMFPVSDDNPYGLTSVGQEIFVGYAGGSNGKIVVYSRNGGLLRTFEDETTPAAFSLGGASWIETAHRVNLAIGQNATGLDFGSTEPSNSPPVAVDDDESLGEDGTLYALVGVLHNDIDADLAPPMSASLTAEIVQPPANAAAGGFTFNPNGTFTYTPRDNFVGNDSFTYRASDGLTNSGVATVRISVSPVNDAPAFDKGGDKTAGDDSAEQCEAGWATGVSIGPADEAGQSIDFLVDVDKPSLFAARPTIDASGKLCFTPAPNVAGTALVTVRLQDGGGTDGGGRDTSDPRTFTITVTKVYRWHNALNRLNVNNNAGATPVTGQDALIVFNLLNRLEQPIVVSADAPIGVPFFYDTNRDNSVTGIDALLIFNWLNANTNIEAEGEPNSAVIDPPQLQDSASDWSDLILALALDTIGQPKRRRLE